MDYFDQSGQQQQQQNTSLMSDADRLNDITDEMSMPTFSDLL